MKAHCSACHAETEVNASPGDLVECGACKAIFRLPRATPKTPVVDPDLQHNTLALVFGNAVAEHVEQLEAVLVEAFGGPDAFELVKSRAAEKFAEFIDDLERDQGIDLEQLGRAVTSFTPPPPGDAAGAPPEMLGVVELTDRDELLDAIRMIVRQELSQAELLDWLPIRLTGSDVGFAEVAVLVDEQWVTVIAEAGAAVSHIVETAGIEARVNAAMEGTDDDAEVSLGAGLDAETDTDGDDLPTG